MAKCFSFLCWAPPPDNVNKPSKTTRTTNTQITGDTLFRKLPEDVVIYMLRRLPATDLYRLMCVSKLFKSLISRSCFLNLHISFITARPHPTNHLLFRKDGGRNRFFFCYRSNDSKNSTTFSSYKSVEIPCRYESFSTGYLEVVSSIGGVICFYHRSDPSPFGTLFLWNPFMGVCKRLPPVPQRWTPIRMAFGFGFDQASADFKVVKIIYRDLYKVNFQAQAFVYSPKTKTWRTIENVPCIADLRDYGCCKGVSVNGAVYWPAYKQPLDYYTPRRPNCIMGFDLVEQVFNVVCLPRDVLIRDDDEFGLSTWHDGKSLAVYVPKEGIGCTWNIFVVNVSESRSKLAGVNWEKKVSLLIPSCFFPRKFINARELVAISTQSHGLSKFILINTEEDGRKDLGYFRSLPFADIIDYTPSLALLDSYCSLERQLELGQNLFRDWYCFSY